MEHHTWVWVLEDGGGSKGTDSYVGEATVREDLGAGKEVPRYSREARDFWVRTVHVQRGRGRKEPEIFPLLPLPLCLGPKDLLHLKRSPGTLAVGPFQLTS